MEKTKKYSVSSHGKTLRLVTLALLIAITIILSFVSIPLFGAFEITLAVLPIIVGAVILGPAASTALGAVFGICSFIMCFGISPFGVLILTENPVYAFIVCVPTRVLVGIIAGCVYKGFSRKQMPASAGIGAVSLVASVSNTVLFLTPLILLYGTQFLGSNIGLESISVVSVIMGLAGVNAIVEAIVCTVLGFGISSLLVILQKRFQN